jgi:hypothetical protein
MYYFGYILYLLYIAEVEIVRFLCGSQCNNLPLLIQYEKIEAETSQQNQEPKQRKQ